MLNQQRERSGKKKGKKETRKQKTKERVEEQIVLNLNYDSEEEEELKEAFAHIARLGAILNGIPFLTQEDLVRHNRKYSFTS